MMKLVRLLLFASAAWLASAASIPAQEIVLRLDPAQTKVEFTLGATLHTVHGTFQFKSGEIRFDPVTGKASGELLLDATSAETGNESRDRKMHEHVLESARYPEIVFRPAGVQGKVAPQGASQVQLHGAFTIHGATHEMDVPVAVEAAGGQYTATARFQVPYVKWGMKNPSTFVLRVGDQVDLSIHTVARPLP